MVTTSKLLKASFLFALSATIGMLFLDGHGTANGQTPTSLEAFFQAIVRDPSTLPSIEDLHATAEKIAGTAPDEIRKALPVVFKALAEQDEKVKAYACSALFAVAGRPDGGSLLKDRIDSIGRDLLQSPFEHIQGGEVVILGRLSPTAPEATHFLLTFVKQVDRDHSAQAGAIFELLRATPESPEVTAAIRGFLSRPIESTTKVGVLNALGNQSTGNIQIVALVRTSLGDPEPSIRLTAIRCLIRMGPGALRLAGTELNRLASDPSQPADVREEATQALERLHSNDK
jgi:hypothetical protein